MRLAMAQMKMSKNYAENLKKTEKFIKDAQGCDLIFFPEVQQGPFFAQYRAENLPFDLSDFITDINSDDINKFRSLARENNIYVSPNFYVKNIDGRLYDMSLFIDRGGNIIGKSAMVNVDNNPFFFERDYYTPSKDGYGVFDTGIGKIGIVICYDRHFEESFESCARQGAKLVIVPTANTLEEDMDFFEREIISAAVKNKINIAMCNRVGKEDKMTFAGQSLIVAKNGEVLFKAGDGEELVKFEFDL